MKPNDILRYIVIGGVFLLPFVPFLVTSSMFFPFITGKNFAFRIIVEIIFGAWFLLALRDARYRPAFSWILVALATFLVVIGLADLFGENVFKSFWSNFERMEGWFALLHLFLYFLVAGSVLTTTRIWGWLAHTSVVASVFICLYGVGQFIGELAVHQSDVRLDATIGNSAYLAIYLVFHIFITLVLMARFKGSNWVRYLYLIPVSLQIFILYHTATRGAILGFLGGALLAALAIAIFERERRTVRRVAVGLLVAVVALLGTFFVIKDTSFVGESPVLSRFASISLTESTTLSRFTIWDMALDGFREHPVLGWGQENFNLVFNEYFQPKLYDHEPWFDRVHDIALDWLIAGGVLGLLTYLLIPLATLYYLWHPRSRVHFSATERGLWTGLLAAYGFHNLFVFDNILSYLLFFSVLAYVHTRVSKPASETSWFAQPINDGTFRVFVPLVVVLMLGSLYFFNWQGIMTARALISGLGSADPEERIEALERAASYDALGRQEVAEQIAQSAVQFAQADVSSELRQRIFSLAEREIQEEIERAPDDARLHLFLASLYDRYSLYEQAKVEYERALELSPEKQGIWHQAAFNRLYLEQYAEAQAFMKKAHEFDPSFDEPRVYYAVGSLYAGDVALSDQILEGVTKEASVINSELLLNAYANLGLQERLLGLLEARVQRDPANPQLHLSLASTYFQLGRGDEAVAEIERVIELDPNFKEQGQVLIEEIRGGSSE